MPVYKEPVTLTLGKRKDTSKASYVLTLPKRVVKRLDWDLKVLLNKRRAIICELDEWNRVIYEPLPQFKTRPLQRVGKIFSELNKDYRERKKNPLAVRKIWITDLLQNQSLPHLKKRLPELEEDVHVAEGYLLEVEEHLKIQKHALEMAKKIIKELEKQQKEEKSSKKALKKGTK